MEIHEFLPLLKGVKQHGDYWTALCPAHDDQKSSLSVRAGDDGRILAKCHTGECHIEDIAAALNIRVGDLFPKDSTGSAAAREIVGTYDYTDEQGQLLYQVVRYWPKDFRQRRPTGPDAWDWKLGDVRRVLYNLETLSNADPEEMIYVVEGEKDVKSLSKLGLLATSNAGGAGKWRDEYSDSLKGRIVALLPDNDAPGKAHMQQVRASLTSIAAEILVVNLPNLPEKGDVSDFIARHKTPAEAIQALSREVERARAQTAPGIRYIDFTIEPQPIEWYIKDWVAKGDIITFAGRAGAGKSTTAVELAIAIAGGRNGSGWIGEPIIQTTPVLYWDEEAGEDEMRRQLKRQQGYGIPNLYVSSCCGLNLLSEESRARMAYELETRRPGLVVLDTASHFFAGAREDKADEITPVFRHLIDWREIYKTTFLLVHHFKKPSNQGHDDTLDRVRGSTAFTTQASVVWGAVPAIGGNAVDLSVEKRRGGRKLSMRVRYLEENGLASLVSDGIPEQAETDLDRCARSMMDTLAESSQEIWETNQIVQIGTDQNLSKRTAEGAKALLVKTGFLRTIKRGKYTVANKIASDDETLL